jgi:hypothetical protein
LYFLLLCSPLLSLPFLPSVPEGKEGKGGKCFAKKGKKGRERAGAAKKKEVQTKGNKPYILFLQNKIITK